MRQQAPSLRQYVRQVLLTEQVFGAQAFVYHGSDAEPEVFIPALINDEFKPGRGDLYGPGLYTVYSRDPYQPTFEGSYGRYVYQLKVNLYGFVIFDEKAATKVYGAPYLPREQLKLFGEDELAKKMSAMQGSGSWAVPWSSDDAYSASKFLSGKVKGVVFTGRQDGQVAVIYDSSGVVPVAFGANDQTYLKKIDKSMIRAALRRSVSHEFEKDRWEDKEWRDEQGRLHRDGDQPAVIEVDGGRAWFQHGNLHRDGDKPAVIEIDGSQLWYQDGEKHRDGDKPAVIWADGTQAWWKNGKFIRQEGPK